MNSSTERSLAQARAKFNEQQEKLARQVEAFKQQSQRYATENRARSDWATVGTMEHLTEAMARAINDLQSALDYQRMKAAGKVSGTRFCGCGHEADAWCEERDAWECGDCHGDKCEFVK